MRRNELRKDKRKTKVDEPMVLPNVLGLHTATKDSSAEPDACAADDRLDDEPADGNDTDCL